MGVVLLTVLAAGVSGAQLPGASTDDARDRDADADDRGGVEMPGPGGGLEAAIDEQTYLLGPGDILALSVWGPKPVAYELPVTLEGMVLIPEVGEIDVDGMVLADAKSEIRDRVLDTFRNVTVSVNLTVLRRFQIHVLGQVPNPGTYLGTAVDRVSNAVARAGGFAEGAGQRRVLVKGEDGEIRARADLYSFLQRGERANNPRLQDGDIVLVPFVEERIRVLGAVNSPGPVEYLEGDTFSDALQLAAGFTHEVFADTIEVARYVKGSRDPQRFFVINGGGIETAPGQPLPPIEQLPDTFSPPAIWLPSGDLPVYRNFRMQPNDIVLVRRVPEIRLQRLVEVQGEVRFPGEYPVFEGQTRISDLIQWAGGLTDEASLVEAQLIRREAIQLTDREFERLQNIPVADMREDEYNYFKMKSRENPGRMVVDFYGALVEGDEAADLLLERGDLVVIPKRKDFVSVLGMVASPGNVTYRPGLDAYDYIDRSGGFADNAKKGDSRVIRASGGEWIKLKEAGPLNPGDVVMVPEKPERDYWAIARDVLIASTQILAIWVLVRDVTN